MSIEYEINNLLKTTLQTFSDFLSIHKKGIIIIRGATATGKTGLSLQLAEQFNAPFGHLTQTLSLEERAIAHKGNILLGGEGAIGNMQDVSLRQYKTTPEYILPVAKGMRKQPTKAEEFFWHNVKNRKLDGKKWRRQHPFGRYIADFYCDELKLVVEIDGEVHLNSDVFASDQEKTYFMSAYGVTVHRISNEVVLTNRDDVVEQLRANYLPSPLRRRVGDEVLDGEKHIIRKIEIISADSRQVYRSMDIGTDKVSAEDQASIPHRGLDLVNPDEEFTAGQWKTYTETKIAEIHARGNIPVVVGGTGLYIDMLYRNFSMPELAPQRERRDEMLKKEQNKPGRLYDELFLVDPEEAQKHHAHSHRYLIRALEIWTFTGKTKTQRSGEQPVQRPLLMLGLWREKETTNQLIDERIDELFDRGLVQEVRGLLDAGYTADLQSMNTIGYKEIVGYLQGAYDLDTAKELLKQNTHRLAKRQRTWFRKYLYDAEHNPKEQVTYTTLFL